MTCTHLAVQRSGFGGELWAHVDGRVLNCPLSGDAWSLAENLQNGYGGLGVENRDRCLVFADWVEEYATGMTRDQAEAVAATIRRWSQF